MRASAMLMLTPRLLRYAAMVIDATLLSHAA